MYYYFIRGSILFTDIIYYNQNRQRILAVKSPSISDVVQRLRRSDTRPETATTTHHHHAMIIHAAASDELMQKYLLRLRQKLKAPLQLDS